MFGSRLHLLWLSFCAVIASFWAAFVLSRLISEGGPPGAFDGVLGLAAFLLLIYTLPVVSFYLLGIGIAKLVRSVVRWAGRSRRRKVLADPARLPT